MDKLLTLEPGMLIWTFITFALLLWVLKLVAWKPLLSALEGREQRIASDLEKADEARREGERLLAEHRKLLENSEREARRIIDEAKHTAETMKQGIVDSANEQARQMTAQARAEIQREKDTALLQLREEVADLAVRAAGKILGEELDANRHRAMVDEFINTLPRN
ncbi:MAG TPA: F0F1 ATP synthase subunit B [Bacteroidota bacterium]|nr:F0F1 ATP synthase subunit B [Bacteroidota bacterium]